MTRDEQLEAALDAAEQRYQQTLLERFRASEGAGYVEPGEVPDADLSPIWTALLMVLFGLLLAGYVALSIDRCPTCEPPMAIEARP